jgi:hypothetical protein
MSNEFTDIQVLKRTDDHRPERLRYEEGSVEAGLLFEIVFS